MTEPLPLIPTQDCLSGEGKTLMLVNISPTIASSHETYCSLKFAGQVNQVQLGTAKKNITITTRAVSAASAPAPVAALLPLSSHPPTTANPSPPPRARPPLSHQSSFPSPPPPVTTTTLAPSQASTIGNKSQFALAPAARVTSVPVPVPVPAPAESASTIRHQPPLTSLPSARAKRQAVFPSAAPASTSATAGTATAPSNLTQAPKRIKSAKAGGTWR
jgi:hypothetical protein